MNQSDDEITNESEACMKIDMAALTCLIKGLRAESEVFATNDLRCLNVSDKSSGCFMDQGNVIEKNGQIRTFDRYDTNAMCATCTAYWHIDRALSTLRDLKAIAEKFGTRQQADQQIARRTS